MATVIFIIVAIGLITEFGVYGSIYVQNDQKCGTNWDPQLELFQNRDEEIVISQTTEYYFPEHSCIVRVKGKVRYQIEVTITQFAVDGDAELDAFGNPVRCHDFLKLFNGPTVDNARLLIGIPPWGLCGTISTGSELPMLRHFRTSQNDLTIQFRTDQKNEFKRGFVLQLRQYEWSNAGNLNPDGYSPGGWNDGSLNEFQMNWDNQQVIPGDLQPGGGDEYEKERYGISCYDCEFCDVEWFEPERENTQVESNCYLCGKEWDDEYQSARRKCYYRREYQDLLTTFQEQDTVTEFVGCKRILSTYNRQINYCFCDEDKCNSAKMVDKNVMAMLLCVLFTVVVKQLNTS